jgi:hypothetical protein
MLLLYLSRVLLCRTVQDPKCHANHGATEPPPCRTYRGTQRLANRCSRYANCDSRYANRGSCVFTPRANRGNRRAPKGGSDRSANRGSYFVTHQGS